MPDHSRTDPLAGLPQEVTLRPDRARPATPSAAVGVATAVVPAPLREALDRLAAGTGCGRPEILLAAVAAALSRHGAGADVPVAAVGADGDVRVTRVQLGGDPTFAALLDRVKVARRGTGTRPSGPAPDPAVPSAVRVAVAVGTRPGPEPSLLVPGSVRLLDLAVEVRPDAAGRLRVRVPYAADLYEPATVQAFADRLMVLLASATAAPGDRLSTLDWLRPKEREALLCADTARPVPAISVVDQVEARVAAAPESVAVVCAGVPLRYGELNAAANRLAHRLVAQGVRPGDHVAVALPRSGSLVTALLAVLKAGAAYVPLDPEHPADRIAWVLADSRPALLLTTAELAGRLPAGPPTLLLDAGAAPGAEDPEDPGNLGLPVRPAQPVYTIYTSGSTGRPKGVVVPSGALVNFLAGMAELVPLTAADRWLAVTTVSFDMANLELWLPLTSGATVLLATRQEVLDPRLLAGVAGREGATVLQATPSRWQGLVEPGAQWLRDRRMLVGGEPVPAALAATMAAAGEVLDVYGPTETTVWSTAARLDGVRPPRIGRPIVNTTAYVLDATLRPVPVGVPGELYLGGAGLALGYAGRPRLTAERFVADPYGPAGGRLYRTGDLVRWLPDGELDFLSRVDDQIKLRGFRIEPREIEAVLAAHPAVDRAAVVLREDRPGDRRLVGYLVPRDPHSATGVQLADVRAYAARRLPDYMLPAALVSLAALPLTPNGKLDRARLPAPAVEAGTGGNPTTPAERMLCVLVAEVLGLARVGVEDDFFALGGDSLSAGRLVAALRTSEGVEVPLADVFEAPTVTGLAGRLAAGPATMRPPVRAVGHGDRTELSHGQLRLWFAEQKVGPGPTYHEPVAVRLRGPLDLDALAAALADLAARHEPLRTVFPLEDGVPRQQVLAPAPVPLRLGRCAEADLDAHLRTLVDPPFDLATDRPLRADLVEVGPEDRVLLLTLHHIATDGWSNGPLLRDLAASYAARRGGRAPDPTPLPVAYRDYAVWHRELLGAGGQLDRDLAYWTGALAGLPAEVPLPVDRAHRSAGRRAGGTVPVEVARPTYDALLRLAAAERATLFMALQAATAALLSRLGAGTDIPLGTMVSGREDGALAELVGFFANTVVLRTDVSGRPTFRQLLRRVRATGLALHAHREVLFERLVEELRPVRAPNEPPLFHTMLVLQPDVGPPPEFPGVAAQMLPVETATAKVDLTFSLAETPAGLHGTLRYATDLFDEATARALADRLGRFLTAVAADPDRMAEAVDVLLPCERPAPAPATADPVPATVHGLVAARAATAPAAMALVAGDRRVTYGQLEERANRLAHHLAAAGVGRGDVVGLHLPRTDQLVVALLATLKAGAAFTVLDVAFPPARLAAVLDQAGVRTVLGVGSPRAPGGRLQVDLDAEAEAIAARPARPPGVPVGAADPACVLFTSGSTGVPQGVLSPHRALVGTLAGQAYSGFGPGEVTLQSAPVSWDAFARQVFGPLIGGGTCVLQPGQRPEPAVMARLVAEHGVTVLDTAASLFTHLWDERPEMFAGLRWALTGGEAPSAGHLAEIRAAHPDLRIVNGYGPVESMGYTTAFRADAGWPGSVVPIGRPVPTKSALVLDPLLRPVPAGVRGEVYLGGAGLAYGYAGRPGPTAARFVADPYGRPGERLYRTGDLARRRLDGVLEYLGRADGQAKVRGFRVDPEETRTVLVRYPGVRQAAVVVREDRPGDRRLVAYVVPAGGTDPDEAALHAHARERLPEHLLPAAYVPLPALPRTANGKLDRSALPAPVTPGRFGRAPQTAREHRVCAIFAEVLGVPSVSADDDFFRLGGHSLLVMRLLGRIRREFRAELSVASVFDAPTAAGLADRLTDATPARPALRVRDRRKETM